MEVPYQELSRLGDFLKRCKGGEAMNLEELDGFFAALIAGPDLVLPSEYLPEVFGGEMADTSDFSSLDEANEILALLNPRLDSSPDRPALARGWAGIPSALLPRHRTCWPAESASRP